MILNLPIFIFDFFMWFFIKVPKRILTISKRVIVLINYELALVLNIKLLFTPLFGDYTFVGRALGFIFRFGTVVLGSILMLFLSTALVFVPIIWLAFPIFLFAYIKFWSLLIILFIFVVKEIFYNKTPRKRVTDVGDENFSKAFKPEVLHYLKSFEVAGSRAVERFLASSDIHKLLLKLELENDEFKKSFVKISSSMERKSVEKLSFDYAKEQKTRYVESEHLFLALLGQNAKIDSLLSSFSSSLSLCESGVAWVVQAREELSKIFFWQEDYELLKMGGINRGMTGRVTPVLDSVSHDFTQMARKGYVEKFVGREKIIDEITELMSSSRVNVLLIGEPGCGKTTLVKGLASGIIRGAAQETLKFKRIVSLDPGSLMAGTKSVGDITGKMTRIMQEIEGSGGIVVFIDEIHNLLINSGGETSEISGVFSTLEPYLSSGNVQFMGATSIKNYRKYIEPNGEFSRLFQIVEVPEPSDQETLDILKVVSEKFEKEFNIVISYPSLVKTIEFSKKLIHERVFPDKAIDILNRACAREQKQNKYLTFSSVAEIISEVAHVPVSSISEDESKKLMNIEEDMKKYVIGQDGAIIQIGKALKRARVGVRDESKPIASFLFVGTTGVGKTETAKTLAKIHFGSEKSMVRLDMSEYQQQDSINRLIGSPDGSYKGFLTDAIRSKPFSLVLLDEIEKANSNILLTFLQVLDDGRLTDSSGRVIDFTNTIIIATSNVGTRSLHEIVSRGGLFDEMSEAVLRDVRTEFAPEFLNRFTGIIVFRPLNTDSVRKIADLMLKKVREMAKNKGIKVIFKNELITELVKRGFDAKMGARPLARVIEDSVETYLAQQILSNEINKGDEISLGKEVFS